MWLQFGVKIKTKGETKRDRRVTPEEERKLLEAADKLSCAEHAFAGAPMRDRIIGALETGCRLGEMLKIQNRHVLWDTHQISIPAAHAKDAEARRIPFEPNGRLAHILKRRRFLGPKAFVFGGAAGEYQGTIRTAWESLVLLANGIEPTRTRAQGESIVTGWQKSICTGMTYGTKPLAVGWPRGWIFAPFNFCSAMPISRRRNAI